MLMCEWDTPLTTQKDALDNLHTPLWYLLYFFYIIYLLSGRRPPNCKPSRGLVYLVVYICAHACLQYQSPEKQEKFKKISFVAVVRTSVVPPPPHPFWRKATQSAWLCVHLPCTMCIWQRSLPRLGLVTGQLSLWFDRLTPDQGRTRVRIFRVGRLGALMGGYKGLWFRSFCNIHKLQANNI